MRLVPRRAGARQPFQPQTGLRVVTHGRMDVYESSGALQLYVDALQPSGFGDLAIRFEQLKARLGAEGLFDTARKRPLPVRPATVAVITSPVGGRVAGRVPRAGPALAAGPRRARRAARSRARALRPRSSGAFRRLEKLVADGRAAGRADEVPAVTILARGGGSLEDLWAFNDERVVRAVVAHTVPVVCGVGHEVDVTLADFAADVRAPTPSAAAELVVPDRAEMAAGRGRGAPAAGSRGASGRWWGPPGSSPPSGAPWIAPIPPRSWSPRGSAPGCSWTGRRGPSRRPWRRRRSDGRPAG